MTAWWDGIAPSEIALDCAGYSHRLRWADGELTALDHADPAGERALAALGGEPIACIDLLDRWHRHRDDLDVLVLASRGPADPLRTAGNAQGRMTFASPAQYQAMAGAKAVPGLQYSGSYRPVSEPADEAGELLQLGSGLPDRLVATVIAAWTDRVGTGPVPAAIHAAMYGRLSLALRTWLGEDSLDVELTLLPDGGQARIVREPDVVRIEAAVVMAVADLGARIRRLSRTILPLRHPELRRHLDAVDHRARLRRPVAGNDHFVVGRSVGARDSDRKGGANLTHSAYPVNARLG